MILRSMLWSDTPESIIKSSRSEGLNKQETSSYSKFDMKPGLKLKLSDFRDVNTVRFLPLIGDIFLVVFIGEPSEQLNRVKLSKFLRVVLDNKATSPLLSIGLHDKSNSLRPKKV